MPAAANPRTLRTGNDNLGIIKRNSKRSLSSAAVFPSVTASKYRIPVSRRSGILVELPFLGVPKLHERTLQPADFRVPRAVSGTCCYRTVLRCRAGAAGAAARQLGGCRVIIATGTVNFVPSCAVISPIGFLRRFIPGFWLAE